MVSVLNCRRLNSTPLIALLVWTCDVPLSNHLYHISVHHYSIGPTAEEARSRNSAGTYADHPVPRPIAAGRIGFGTEYGTQKQTGLLPIDVHSIAFLLHSCQGQFQSPLFAPTVPAAMAPSAHLLPFQTADAPASQRRVTRSDWFRCQC